MISIVIPVYNEEKAIITELNKIIQTMDDSKLKYEIICVDDGSKDKSAEIIEKEFPKVHLIRQPYNRGEGCARKTGTIAAKGDIVVTTDADGTYPAYEIPRIVGLLKKYDMVIGARKAEMGTWRLLRTPAKAFIRVLAEYLTNRRIPDLNSGLRAWRKDQFMKFINILPDTHSLVSTITIAYLTNGLTVGWTPIEYYKRIGKSSFHPIKDTSTYLSLVIRAITYFKPLKIFLPISLIMLAVGIGKMFIYDIPTYNWHFSPSTITLVLSGFQFGAIALLADLIVKKSK